MVAIRGLLLSSGGIAYLADQAIGGSLAVQFGFENAFWGILAAAVIIFLTGIPIAYYCAKYNVDVDLLTRARLRLSWLNDHLRHLRVIHLHLLRA